MFDLGLVTTISLTLTVIGIVKLAVSFKNLPQRSETSPSGFRERKSQRFFAKRSAIVAIITTLIAFITFIFNFFIGVPLWGTLIGLGVAVIGGNVPDLIVITIDFVWWSYNEYM